MTETISKIKMRISIRIIIAQKEQDCLPALLAVLATSYFVFLAYSQKIRPLVKESLFSFTSRSFFRLLLVQRLVVLPRKHEVP